MAVIFPEVSLSAGRAPGRWCVRSHLRLCPLPVEATQVQGRPGHAHLLGAPDGGASLPGPPGAGHVQDFLR